MIPRQFRALRGAFTALVIAAFAISDVAAAQGLMHGALHGSVRGTQGEPVREVELRIIERASGATRSAMTGRDGAFRFALLGPGLYDVHAEALGYRPVVMVNVELVAGQVQTLRLVLRREAPPVTTIDTVRAFGAQVAPIVWAQQRAYGELAAGRRLVSDAASLSPIADEIAVEGLPWRHATVMVDGARLGSVSAPSGAGLSTFGLALPSRSASRVSVGGIGFDVEAAGSGVGLSVQSLRAGSSRASRSAVFGGSSDVGAAAVFGGPLQRDTAHAVFGIDYQRSEVKRPAWFLADDAEGLQLITIASSAAGVDLSAYRNETPQLEERASGFGRLDWQLGDRYAVVLRGAGSRLATEDPGVLGATSAGFGSRQVTIAAQASINVVARLSDRLTSELRLSGEMGDASAERAQLTTTSFAGRGIVVGAASDEPFSDQRVTPRLAAMLHWDLGVHRVKFGATLGRNRVETQGALAFAGGFRYGDAADFLAGNGAWNGLSAVGGSGSFQMQERAIFVQDAWRVSDGFDLSLGLRFDANSVSAGQLTQNTEWTALTGSDNSDVVRRNARVSPRVGFRWSLGSDREWLIEGGAGVYHDLPDHRDVAEALTFDTGVVARSMAGTLASWPAAPDSVVAPIRGQTMSLLGPGFEGPRTRRMSLSLQRSLGGWTTYVQGVYRQTDFLARRRDLNLPATSVGADQYGRPLYGSVRQLGSLLVAQPGSNRRFSQFDAVTAIEVTGFSDYRGATVGIERVVDVGLSVGAHYTYSRTEDNLVQGTAPRASLGGSRDVGVADTDIPHRVLATLEWSLPPSGAVRFGAVYRLRSGTPFTPGFREGVDADADGATGNDAAFIDGALAGMDQLIAEHACLQRAAGRFAVRNDCRGPIVHRLDLRAAFRLRSLASGPLELVLDAINVLPSIEGRIDRALVLVDRSGTVTTNPGTGITSVPLVVNPGFGEVLSDRSAGMLFRLGLRIGR